MTLVTPLTDLKKAKAPQAVQYNKASTEIEYSLSQQPVLQYLDFSLTFILQTGASTVELGVMLSQNFQGMENLTLCISWKLQLRETGYSP